MSLTLWIIIGVVVLVILWVIFAFNRLVTLRARVKEAWSDIDVQLKRRYNLIPNVIETVKGYAKHEEGVFTKVTEARTRALGAESRGDVKEVGRAENMLAGTLKTLFAVAENYPDLKANANFLDLQRELADTENKIQAARRFYNNNVRDLNILVQTFPSRIIAGMFSFAKETFFELGAAAEREVVDVKF